jgi:hypothetical protein
MGKASMVKKVRKSRDFIAILMLLLILHIKRKNKETDQMKRVTLYSINILLLIFLIVNTIGCNNNSKKQHKTYVKKYYLNGSLKQEGYYINDNTPADTIRVYNKKGRLISLNIYSDKGVLNGSCIYYDNGVIKQQKHYLNCKLGGVCKNFYKNGALKSKVYFFNGVQVGDANFYSEDGHVALYNFFDFLGRNRVLREYDSSGEEITNIGKTLFIDSSFAINDTLVSADTFKIAILISHPPRTRLNIYAEVLDSAKNIIKRPKIDKHNQIAFLYVPIFKGLYNVRVTCSQFDSVSNRTKVMIENNILK